MSAATQLQVEQSVRITRYQSCTPCGLWHVAKSGELLRYIESTAWRPTGAASVYAYDSPWTLSFFRRNEVVIPLLPSI